MLTFPRDLISAQMVEWALDAPPSNAGLTLGGVPRLVFLSGGPFWRLALDGLVMHGDEAIRAGNALQGALLGGTPILVRPCDCRQTPIAVGSGFGSAPESEGAPFDDVIDEEANPIVATCAAAALRSISLTLAMSGSFRALVGGEQLSIDHTNWGPRMYRIKAVTGGTDSAPMVKITPPLREAVTNGTTVDFNRPGSVMQAAGAFEISPDIPNKLHRGRVNFVEYPGPLS